VVRGTPFASGAGSLRIWKFVFLVIRTIPWGRLFVTVKGMAWPSIMTSVVSPSTKVRSIRRFLTKFVKSSSTFRRMSTGARTTLVAFFTVVGLIKMYSFMETPAFLRVKPSMRIMPWFWSSL